MQAAGFPRPASSHQRKGGGQRLQPVFCIVCQASMALCRSIRRRVIGSVGGRNVAVRPDGDPLRMLGRRVELEVTELLLLLGIQPTFTTRLFWRLVAAVFAGHARSVSQT